VAGQEEWSLARKAAHYEGMLHARHDRHGMTSECNTAAFGAVEASCVMHDSDNNGLWTSLVVGAEYYRYRVTGEPEALSSGSRFFSGMVLLNEISGKRGLMARSACDPQEANVTCAVGGAGGEGRQWLPSPVPKYSGWLWKSDTSSDEVVGHIFALLAVAQLSPTPAEREACVIAMQAWTRDTPKDPTRARTNLVHTLINHNDFITLR
jgi:hypothetical protein